VNGKIRSAQEIDTIEKGKYEKEGTWQDGFRKIPAE
jgi:hypothetical protein